MFVHNHFIKLNNKPKKSNYGKNIMLTKEEKKVVLQQFNASSFP